MKNIKIDTMDKLKHFYKENGLINYYKNSHYGAHQNTAIKIFKEHPLFGVGIKILDMKVEKINMKI